MKYVGTYFVAPSGCGGMKGCEIMAGNKTTILHEMIECKMYVIRGKRVMGDRDLAVLYGVTTKRLNEQVKRNRKRFPGDFMFHLPDKRLRI